MSTSIVVCSILLTADQQLRVEKLAVITGANLVDRRGVKIDEDRARDVFAAVGLGEDSIELSRVVKSLGVRIRPTILLEAVLE